jgi:hypothetical protein
MTSDTAGGSRGLFSDPTEGEKLMAFAIMRCKKLASMGSVAGALKHCFRERPTPNADPSRTNQNDYLETQSTDEAMGRLRELLPEKRRKDAVLSVEYLMTASPEWWKTATETEQGHFFVRSLEWLYDKFGHENVIAASIHRDETSPHLTAFVVPITKDKRLSAKEFIGTREKLRDDQTSFADLMEDLGLQRGVKRSKARHTTIREYYTNLNQTKASNEQKMASVRQILAKGGDELEALRQQAIAAEERLNQKRQMLARQSAAQASQTPEAHEQPSRGPRR